MTRQTFRGAMLGALVAFAAVSGAAMASDSSIQLNAGTGGPKADTDQLTTGAGTVQRGRTELAGAGASEIAVVASAAPAGTEYGLITRNVPSGTQAVSGTFWQATQPISASALPLPAGASTSAKQPALGTAGSASADVISVQGIASMTALKVDGSATTQPVSGTLTCNAGSGTLGVADQHSNITADYDSGAGTQTMTMYGVALPASGGAVAGGTATNPLRVDVTGSTTQPISGSVSVSNFPATQAVTESGTWTVQPGNTANTTPWLATISQGGNAAAVSAGGALKVDGSAATQPVSGTLTCNVGSAGSLALDATLTGGTARDKITDGTNNAAVKAASTAAAATDPALVVAVSPNNSVAVTGTFWQATQPVSGTVTANQGTAAALSSAWPVKLTDGTNTAPTMDVAARKGFQAITDGTNTATVKAASTAAAFADIAVAVDVRPGGVLPAAAALADATTNPTESRLAQDQFLFNGTSWDRQRNNVNTTTGDTGTKTATFAGATQTNYNARGAIVTVILGTVSGTSPTFSAQLQWSPDGGTTWLSMGAALANLTATNNTGAIIAYPTNISQAAGVTPANLTTGATATAAINVALPRTWRLNYTIAGTSPSFALTSVQVNYLN